MENGLRSTHYQIIFKGQLRCRALGDFGMRASWTSIDLSLAGAAPPSSAGSCGFGSEGSRVEAVASATAGDLLDPTPQGAGSEKGIGGGPESQIWASDALLIHHL